MTLPRKRAGAPTGRRRIDGVVKDVAAMAALLGTSEKKIRARVARGLLPYRRWGGRVVFLTDEVNLFLQQLPGVSVEQALEHVKTRSGERAS